MEKKSLERNQEDGELEFLFEDVGEDHNEWRDVAPDYDDDLDDDFSDDLDEEDKPHPLATAGVFLGLIVLAAIICAVLWSVTHKEDKEDSPASMTESMQEVTVESEGAGELEDSEGETIGSDSTGNDAQNGEETMPESETEVEPGEVSGEDGDVSYIEQTEDAGVADATENSAEQEPVSGNASMEFAEVSDTVTAKDVTNLRSVPSTQDSENVVTQLLNGDTLTRTGMNETTGWSRLEYNGQTVYAVTAYLTTDLTYAPPVATGDPNRITTQDGRVIIFTDCDDNVMPKEYVNLRVEPSTSQGAATAKYQISHGTLVHRTGYSPDSGWSRVEYNGEILYVVSSLVYSDNVASE